MNKMNKKGFTLIEMLVVIAIIAVLVSIVIPTVSSATEKAKEAADVANIRSAIATVTTNALAGGTDLEETVTIKQATAGFVSEDLTTIGGLNDAQFAAVEKAIEDQVVKITADDEGKITVQVDSATAVGPDATLPKTP